MLTFDFDTKMGHVTLTTPLSGIICHSLASTCYHQPTYQI